MGVEVRKFFMEEVTLELGYKSDHNSSPLLYPHPLSCNFVAPPSLAILILGQPCGLLWTLGCCKTSQSKDFKNCLHSSTCLLYLSHHQENMLGLVCWRLRDKEGQDNSP